MARRIVYSISKDEWNRITEEEWEELTRLQYWYNYEFHWSMGRIAFKRFLIFPNYEDFDGLDVSLSDIITNRRRSLAREGRSEVEQVAQIEKDGLVTVHWGGFLSNSIASGFTRVADNEWNAYLVCEFLLKASEIFQHAAIRVCDEGSFIKAHSAIINKRNVSLVLGSNSNRKYLESIVDSRHVFSIVDRRKYDEHKNFRNTIPGFKRMEKDERLSVIRHWNWLGYEGSYDEAGDDLEGYDLNLKAKRFYIHSVS